MQISREIPRLNQSEIFSKAFTSWARDRQSVSRTENRFLFQFSCQTFHSIGHGALPWSPNLLSLTLADPNDTIFAWWWTECQSEYQEIDCTYFLVGRTFKIFVCNGLWSCIDINYHFFSLHLSRFNYKDPSVHSVILLLNDVLPNTWSTSVLAKTRSKSNLHPELKVTPARSVMTGVAWWLSGACYPPPPNLYYKAVPTSSPLYWLWILGLMHNSDSEMTDVEANDKLGKQGDEDAFNQQPFRT